MTLASASNQWNFQGLDVVRISATGGFTGNLTGNASTATALAANPTDCSANQFANAIAASGNLTCTAIADADIPDTITASNYLLLTGGTLTGGLFGTTASLSSKLEVGTGDQFTVLGASGNTIIGGTLGVTGLATFTNASVSANFEVKGYASASQYFGAGVNGAGDCNDATDKLMYDVGTGLFSCGTLADADIPDNLTLGTITGTIDAGGATSFEIPNGAAPTIDAEGEIAVDTSGFGQFVYYASSSVHTLTDEKKTTISMASTSFNAFASRSLGYQFRGITVKKIWCKVASATSVVVNLGDGTNDTDQLTCTTAGVFDDGSIANSTLTKGEELILERRTVTGEADFLTITYTYVETRE